MQIYDIHSIRPSRPTFEGTLSLYHGSTPKFHGMGYKTLLASLHEVSGDPGLSVEERKSLVENALIPISKAATKIEMKKSNDYVKREKKKKLPFQGKIPVDIKTLPTKYDLDAFDVLGGGRFGCVVEMPLTDKNKTKIAVKMEIVDPKDAPQMLRPNSEIYSTFVTSEMTGWPKVNPFAMKTVAFRRIPIDAKLLTSLKKRKFNTQSKCESFGGELTKAAIGKSLQIIETEILSPLSKEIGPFDTAAIRNATFQLFYSTSVQYERFGILHNDVKIENLLTRNSSPRIRIHSDYGRFEIPEGSMIFTFIDYGVALSPLINASKMGEGLPSITNVSDKAATEYSLGTPGWLTQDIPLYYKTTKTLKRGGFENTNIPERGIGSDVWALGLVITNLCLAGWHPKDFDDDLRLEKLDTLEGFGIIEMLSHETKLNESVESIIDVNKLKYVSLITEDDLKAFFVVMNFQEALGNGMLPNVPERDHSFGQIYWWAKKKSNMDKIRASSKNWKKPGGRGRGTPSIFKLAVERIKLKVGEDGLDFVKKCLSWSASERDSFGRWEPGKIKRWHEHPFLKEFRREEFDYVEGEDYFFYL